MEVVLVAAKKDNMAEYLDLLKSLNLTPLSLMWTPSPWK